nr:MAG TPA: hypothetical protein [Caudoviricetes sp.]
MPKYKVSVECHTPGRDEIHWLKLDADNEGDAAIQGIYHARDRWPDAWTITVRKIRKVEVARCNGR